MKKLVISIEGFDDQEMTFDDECRVTLSFYTPSTVTVVNESDDGLGQAVDIFSNNGDATDPDPGELLAETSVLYAEDLE